MTLVGAGVGLSARGGLTPLSWAAKGGHEAVVKILLEWDDVNTTPYSRSRGI